ncbi:hypothetical protein ACTFIZ_006743 [Dictyostelium cf. discoideum]
MIESSDNLIVHLIGTSGCGKTSLINSIANNQLIFGDFNAPEENEIDNPNVSKTNKCTTYSFKNLLFSQHPDSWSEKAIGKLKREWDSCMETLDDIFSYIKTLPKVLTSNFKTIFDLKNSVFTSLLNETDRKNKIKEILSNELFSIKEKLLELSQINSHLNIVNQFHSTLKELQFKCRKMAYQNIRDLADSIGVANELTSHSTKKVQAIVYQINSSIQNNNHIQPYNVNNNNNNWKHTFENPSQIDYFFNFNNKNNKQNQIHYFTQNPIQRSQYHDHSQLNPTHQQQQNQKKT